MNVLQIVPSLRLGGVETGTLDMARALITKGHRALVISSGGPLVSSLEAMGAIHYVLPVDRKNPWTILAMARRVSEVVESHEVDVIHARSRVPAIIGVLAWAAVARRASFRANDRQRLPCFITTAHGMYRPHPFSRVMGWGRLVIAISERIARHMIDRMGVPPERLRLIPRGVELQKFPWNEPRLSADKGEWRICTIGRLTPLKGHKDLLRAFGIVAKTFPRSRLLIVGEASPGDAGYVKELQNLIERLGLKEQVEFTGREPDVPRLLSKADLAVLASTGEEGFGRVLIEAAAAGVPVVATRVGGVGEVVIDKKTGLLVPPGDPMALASSMMNLLKDRSFALELSRQGRRRVEALFPVERMTDQTLEAYREASERLRILVVKLSAIGDVALVTPSLRALRGRFPKAHLTVLVGRSARELLHRCPYLDELIVFDPARDRSPLRIWRLAGKLRSLQLDLVVDFQNSRISHWIGFLAGAPQRYGYGGRRWSWLLTHRMEGLFARTPPVEQQFRLLQLLGIQGATASLELWPGPADEARVDEILRDAWLAEHQPLVVIHPGAQWLSKRWPVQRYADLIDRLAAAAKVRVVLTGSASERPIGEEIAIRSKAKPILAMGLTSLNELNALARRAQAFVSGDTAGLHIAAAAGVPLVALFGSTDPLRHLPPAPQVKLLKAELPCSPCYRRVCPRPGNGHMECMRRITVEEVLEAVLSHLKLPVPS
ncbi:MAG: lipopolysaccharide heptosyltransferase II [Candidatus Omnitrophica bacterium]|nr:lipopolysaccharide heptosyltransferase II [Candidatus Omnitrophota bacterium]